MLSPQINKLSIKRGYMHSFIPFTYLLKFTSPIDNTVLYYYGVRYAQKCHPDELFKTYFTNSKKVKHLIKIYGLESFDFEIRKIFPNDPYAAHRWEQKVLRRLNAAKNTKFINMSVGGTIICMKGQDNPSKRQDVRNKISNTLKNYYSERPGTFYNKTHSDATKQKISESKVGKKLSNETRKKMSDSKKGHKVLPHVIEKLRERMKTNNPSKGNPDVSKHLNEMRVLCEHCGIETNKGNYTRWHGDKCNKNH